MAGAWRTLQQQLHNASSFDDFLAAISRAQASGALHQAVRELSGSHGSAALQVLQHVADASLGRQALVRASACPALAHALLQQPADGPHDDDAQGWLVHLLAELACGQESPALNATTWDPGSDAVLCMLRTWLLKRLTWWAAHAQPATRAKRLRSGTPAAPAPGRMQQLLALLVVRVSLDMQAAGLLGTPATHNTPLFLDLLHPLSLTSFLTEYFEQKPLYITRSSGNLLDPMALFPIDAIPRLVDRSFQLPATPAASADALDVLRGWHSSGTLDPGARMRLGEDARLVRVVPTSDDQAAIHEQQAHSPDGRLTLLLAQQACQGGYTLAVRAVGSRLLAVNRLQESMRGVLGGSPGANLYITPPGAQGLAAHFDDHCVWVLQLHGAKQWLVRRPPMSEVLPLAYQPGPRTVPALDSGAPDVTTYTMHAGDVLYIPRGWHHQARSVPTPCPTAAATAGLDGSCGAAFGRKFGAGWLDAWGLAPDGSVHLTLGAEVEPCLTWQAPLQWALARAAAIVADGRVGAASSALQGAQLLLHAVICLAAAEPGFPRLSRLCPLCTCHPEAARQQAGDHQMAAGLLEDVLRAADMIPTAAETPQAALGWLSKATALVHDALLSSRGRSEGASEAAPTPALPPTAAHAAWLLDYWLDRLPVLQACSETQDCVLGSALLPVPVHGQAQRDVLKAVMEVVSALQLPAAPGMRDAWGTAAAAAAQLLDARASLAAALCALHPDED